MFRAKTWLSAAIMSVTIAACGVGAPAYSHPTHALAAGEGHEPPREPNFYRAHAPGKHNRLSQKGKRKRARWVR